MTRAYRKASRWFWDPVHHVGGTALGTMWWTDVMGWHWAASLVGGLGVVTVFLVVDALVEELG